MVRTIKLVLWSEKGSTIIGGSNNKVGRSYSTAMGQESIAFGHRQFVFGKYNIPDEESQYALIVGGGIPDERKNILTLDWDGNLDISGTITGSVVNGKTAYELALDNDFEGTIEEWLESLKGSNGEDGKTAYELALDNGFEGNRRRMVRSLKAPN